MFIPYGQQSIGEDDIEAVYKVLGSKWLTQGPKVGEFESKLAKYCGAKYAVAVSNGTAALHLAYLAAGIGAGDEVITTPNTFVATSNMLLAVGAKPVFCDIRSDTNNIDEKKIEKLITKKTKAIVPVHFAGHPCEMETIWKIARKHNLKVVNDGAQVLGACYKGKPVGGELGDMCTFSFHAVKSITTGEGGAIVTNNKKYFDKLKLLRSHGVTKDKKGFIVMKALGYNYRLTDIQAALGTSQLKKLSQFIKKRHEVVALYSKYLKDINQIILPQEMNSVVSSWHLYMLLVKDARKRLPLMKHLRSKGIAVNMHYPAVYSHPFYKQLNYNYTNVKLPVMNAYQKRCITMPCFPDLSEKNIKYICDAVKTFFV